MEQAIASSVIVSIIKYTVHPSLHSKITL